MKDRRNLQRLHVELTHGHFCPCSVGKKKNHKLFKKIQSLKKDEIFIVENLAHTGKSHKSPTDDTLMYAFIS